MAVLNGNHFLQILLDNETLDMTIEGSNFGPSISSVPNSTANGTPYDPLSPIIVELIFL